MAEIKLIAVEDLQPNRGQVPGIPKNPRRIDKKQLENLKRSLLENPEMQELKEVIVKEYDGQYIVMDGNMRLKALKEIGQNSVLCKLIPEYFTPEQTRAAIIKFNTTFGDWDEDLLRLEWADCPLDDWGIEIEGGLSFAGGIDEEDGEAEEEVQEKIPEAEELLNKAMQQYCGEFADQYDVMLAHGWAESGLTKGYAKLKFLRAKYYGKKYPRHCSLVFTPEQFMTSANTRSYYEQLKITAKEGKAGNAGFRHLSNDNKLNVLFSTSYPIGGGRMPLDFPVEKAREIIKKYANGGRVLDPCHGWGGRLVASMLEDVEEYVGVDPSPSASRGVNEIYNTFSEYSKTKATLLKACYEDTQMEDGYFDMALTSPPYFDVEQYDGEEQAHVKYDNYALWGGKFYKPLIVNTMQRLKKGGVFALQVGNQSYPLVDDAIKICNEYGFTVEKEADNFLGKSTIHNTSDERSEQLLIIRK